MNMTRPRLTGRILVVEKEMERIGYHTWTTMSQQVKN
jgi:hypothetical protein